jgi:hypothetical protein
MTLDSIGKVLAMWGVVTLALSITPTGDFIDPDDFRVVTQWKWLKRWLRHGQYATPVTVNPLLLYLGILLSVIGIALT